MQKTFYVLFVCAAAALAQPIGIWIESGAAADRRIQHVLPTRRRRIRQMPSASLSDRNSSFDFPRGSALK